MLHKSRYPVPVNTNTNLEYYAIFHFGNSITSVFIIRLLKSFRLIKRKQIKQKQKQTNRLRNKQTNNVLSNERAAATKWYI